MVSGGQQNILIATPSRTSKNALLEHRKKGAIIKDVGVQREAIL